MRTLRSSLLNELCDDGRKTVSQSLNVLYNPFSTSAPLYRLVSPSSQAVETCRHLASATNSKSVTYRSPDSIFDTAVRQMAMPASIKHAERSTCENWRLNRCRACLRRAPTIFFLVVRLVSFTAMSCEPNPLSQTIRSRSANTGTWWEARLGQRIYSERLPSAT